MTEPAPDLSTDMDALLAAVGITGVTAEGKARARAEMDAATNEIDHEKRAALRTRVGLPATSTRRRRAA